MVLPGVRARLLASRTLRHVSWRHASRDTTASADNEALPAQHHISATRRTVNAGQRIGVSAEDVGRTILVEEDSRLFRPWVRRRSLRNTCASPCAQREPEKIALASKPPVVPVAAVSRCQSSPAIPGRQRLARACVAMAVIVGRDGSPAWRIARVMIVVATHCSLRTRESPADACVTWHQIASSGGRCPAPGTSPDSPPLRRNGTGRSSSSSTGR